ncbi:unnamed protein product [Meloidogyne enterolobii]|uniref:Uncharacterized protein n=1 Tax=Meloidogyne enterolobii TaxID=390850 RepID=A0ACB0YHM2_MELEN
MILPFPHINIKSTLLEVGFIVPVGALNASKVANTILVPGQFIDPKEFDPATLAEIAFRNVDLTMNFIGASIFQTTHNNACESK